MEVPLSSAVRMTVNDESLTRSGLDSMTARDEHGASRWFRQCLLRTSPHNYFGAHSPSAWEEYNLRLRSSCSYRNCTCLRDNMGETISEAIGADHHSFDVC